MKMTRKRDIPTEYYEACCFVDWLELMKQQGKIIDYCHIANESYGGTRADMLRGMKLKRQGRKRGVFDYQIFLRLEKETTRECFFNETGKLNYMDSQEVAGQIICVELKKQKGGTVSPDQKHWQKVYTSCGIPAKICHGAEEAIEFVKKFI